MALQEPGKPIKQRKYRLDYLVVIKNDFSGSYIKGNI